MNTGGSPNPLFFSRKTLIEVSPGRRQEAKTRVGRKREGAKQGAGEHSKETGDASDPPSPSRITPTHEVPTTTQQETGGENTTSG